MPPHQLLGGSLAGKESGPYTSSTRPVESIEGSGACSCSVMPTLCRALTTLCMRCGGCQLGGQFDATAHRLDRRCGCEWFATVTRTVASVRAIRACHA
jgi:hypothetical protein